MSTNATRWQAVLLAALCSTVSAVQAYTVPSPPVAAGDAKAGETRLEDVAQMPCPSGLERFLPGVYYYCVGARDLARHRDGRGLQMLEIAASWGSKPAQLTLGLGYYKGDVAPLNRPLGLAWLGLAAERQDPAFVGLLNSAWNKASPQEQARADELWRAMRPKYGDASAAHRAELRYRRARDELTRNEAYGSEVCIAGLTAERLEAVDMGDAFGRTPSCFGSMPVSVAAKKVDTYAAYLFEGWSGHVSVGPLQQVAPRPKQ